MHPTHLCKEASYFGSDRKRCCSSAWSKQPQLKFTYNWTLLLDPLVEQGSHRFPPDICHHSAAGLATPLPESRVWGVVVSDDNFHPQGLENKAELTTSERRSLLLRFTQQPADVRNPQLLLLAAFRRVRGRRSFYLWLCSWLFIRLYEREGVLVDASGGFTSCSPRSARFSCFPECSHLDIWHPLVR